MPGRMGWEGKGKEEKKISCGSAVQWFQGNASNTGTKIVKALGPQTNSWPPDSQGYRLEDETGKGSHRKERGGTTEQRRVVVGLRPSDHKPKNTTP